MAIAFVVIFGISLVLSLLLLFLRGISLVAMASVIFSIAGLVAVLSTNPPLW